MILRDYQENTISGAREGIKNHRAVMLQGATGSGKSPVFTSILSSLNKNKKTAWLIVPRTDLVYQSSKHLLKWKTPHGLIKPGSNESRAYYIHVVSKDTLIRRINSDKIKESPDYIIFDEAHIAIEQQIFIANSFPESKILGFTASPQAPKGKALSKKGGGLYDILIDGISIPELTARGFLTPMRYFSPKIRGIEDLRTYGDDVNAEDLDKFLEANKIYGRVIEHFGDIAQGRPAISFCRDVKSSYKTAEKFQNAGFKFFCIEGKMSRGKRQGMLDSYMKGEIDGFCCADLLTYGIDLPRAEVGIDMRPTGSLALQMQKQGRILRPFEIRYCHKCNEKYFGLNCFKCGIVGEEIYIKHDSFYFDHVNNLKSHSVCNDIDGNPIPLHYMDKIDWDFHGERYKKKILCETCRNFDRCELDAKMKAKKCEQYRKDINFTLKLCPDCMLYYTGTSCTCGHEHETKGRKELAEVSDIDLKEIKQIKLADRPPEEKREYIDRINTNAFNFEQKLRENIIDSEAVADMIKCADELGNSILWVYWKMVPEKRISVNVMLLEEISRQKGYKTGWVHYQKEKIKNKIESENNSREATARAMGFV
jgi:superfamily II DNA or RNA helicase